MEPSVKNDSHPLYKRRKVWIDSRFQGQYLLRILALEAVVAVVTALLTAFVVYMTISPHFKVGPDWRSVLIAFLIMIALVTAALIWQGVRISHRISGPVFRMSADLKAIRSGGETSPIRLRNHDELQGLAREINLTLDYFHKQQKEPRDEGNSPE